MSGPNADMQAVLGKMVADQLQQMQTDDANFNPRGEQAGQVDSITSEILKNMGGGGGGNPAANLPPELQADFQWIQQALLANTMTIPYVAKHLDGVLKRFNESLHNMMKEAFDYTELDTAETPPRPEQVPQTNQPQPTPNARPDPRGTQR